MRLTGLALVLIFSTVLCALSIDSDTSDSSKSIADATESLGHDLLDLSLALVNSLVERLTYLSRGTVFWLLCALFVYSVHYVFVCRPPQVFVQEGSLAHGFLGKVPSLLRVYSPTPWMTLPFLSGHVQTIATAKTDNAPHIDYTREIFTTPDGGTVSVDWASIPEPLGLHSTNTASSSAETVGNPIIVVCHGLTGGSHENYIRELLRYILDIHPNWGAFVINYRGCAMTEITSPQSHCAAWTDDLRMVLRLVRTRYHNSPFYGIGFSLGANVITKYSGEPDSMLHAVISIGNPFDLQKSMSMLSRHIYDIIYNRALAGNLVSLFEKNYEHFSKVPGINIDSVRNSKSVRDFDDRFTRIVFGYPTVDTYYRRASSCNYVAHIPFPALLISAKDDPVCSHYSIPYDEAISNPNVALVVTHTGGHLGFYEGWKAGRWYPPICDEFFTAVHQHYLENPPSLDARGQPLTVAADPLYSDPWKVSIYPFASAVPRSPSPSFVTDNHTLVVTHREREQTQRNPAQALVPSQPTRTRTPVPPRPTGRSVYIQTSPSATQSSHTAASSSSSSARQVRALATRSWFSAASSVAILLLFYFVVSLFSRRRFR